MLALDLFCGAAGGWSHGLHRAGIETVAACEIDPWRQAMYLAQFPSVRMYGDVRQLTAARLAADGIEPPWIIVGSPPCQDASAANPRGRGVEGERTGLYREWLRLVSELRPVWTCVENSPRLRTRGVDRLLAELESLDYTVWPLVVSAGDIGAPHERERVWVIGSDATRGRCGSSGATQRNAEIGNSIDQRLFTRDAAHANGGGVRQHLGRSRGPDRTDPVVARPYDQSRQSGDGVARVGMVGRSDRDAARFRCDGWRTRAEPASDDRADGTDTLSNDGDQASAGAALFQRQNGSRSWLASGSNDPDAARHSQPQQPPGPEPDEGSGQAWGGSGERSGSDCRNRRFCSACSRWICTGAGWCGGCGLTIGTCRHGPAELPPALRAWARGWPRWNGGLAGLASAADAVGAGELAYGGTLRAAHPAWSDHRIAKAVASRRNRLIAALGDSILPQIAEAIGRAILHA